MSLVQILMLVVLVVMFIAATKWPINIGIMGLVGRSSSALSSSAWMTKRSSKSFPRALC